jgi:hypothetical protein
MRICNVCGSNVQDGVTTCPICGNNLIGAPGQQPNQQPGQQPGQPQNGMQYNQPGQQPGQPQNGMQYNQPNQPGYNQYGQPNQQQYNPYQQQPNQQNGQPNQPPKKGGFPAWAVVLIVLAILLPILAVAAAIIVPAVIAYKAAKEMAEQPTTSVVETTESTTFPTEEDSYDYTIDDSFEDAFGDLTEDFTEEETEETTEATTEADLSNTYIMPELDGTVYKSPSFNYEFDFSEGTWKFSDVNERAEMAGQDVNKINTQEAVLESMKEEGFFYYTLVALNDEETVGVCAYDGYTISTPATVDDEGFIKQLEDWLLTSGDSMTFKSLDTKNMIIDGENHIVLYGTAEQNGTEIKIEMYYYVNGNYCSFIYVIGDDFDKMEQYMQSI